MSRWRVLQKGISAGLAVLLLSGCATRRMRFTSFPPNATVLVGSRQGQTPCTLQIPFGATHATFRLESGLEKEVPLPPLDSGMKDAAESSARVLGRTLQGAGVIVGGAGVLMIILFADGSEDDERWPANEEEDSNSGENFLIGLGVAVSGFGIYALGEWICPEEHHPVLRVDFLEDERPRYIDVGYGAKRLVN